MQGNYTWFIWIRKFHAKEIIPDLFEYENSMTNRFMKIHGCHLTLEDENSTKVWIKFQLKKYIKNRKLACFSLKCLYFIKDTILYKTLKKEYLKHAINSRKCE